MGVNNNLHISKKSYENEISNKKLARMLKSS